jgi:hypothetical protein
MNTNTCQKCPAIEVVPYTSLPLESDQTFDTRAWSYKFPDGRKLTASIAKDGDLGIWVKITKPLASGRESELEFRMSLEAAAVLAQLIDYAIEYPTVNVDTSPPLTTQKL